MIGFVRRAPDAVAALRLRRRLPVLVIAVASILSVVALPAAATAAARCTFSISGLRDDVIVQAGQVVCGSDGDDVIAGIAAGGTFRDGRGNDQVRFFIESGDHAADHPAMSAAVSWAASSRSPTTTTSRASSARSS
jgi:hypothetical protein